MKKMPDKLAKQVHIKALGAGKAATDEQLAKINKFALITLTAEQVHIRRYLMAHNFIDRDNERFTEELLDEFAKSLPGKGFFVEGHPSSWNGSGGPGEGRFFDAATEDMTPEAFTELTGETPKMPDGITNVKVLWGDAYLLKLDGNKDTLAKIDGGIYAFTSIGFKAPYFEVTDERGNYIYGEYRPKGEALEGSLVWLGAQPGATAQKCEGCTKNKKDTGQAGMTIKEGGEKKMKEFLKKLGDKLKKTFSEDNAVEEIAGIISEKDSEIATLKPLSEDGKRYRKDMVEDAVRFGAMAGDIPTDEAGQKTESDFIATWPIERIKDLRDKNEAKARKMFPDKFTVKSKDEEDKLKKEKEAEALKPRIGKKDYTDPKQNELLSVEK